MKKANKSEISFIESRIMKSLSRRKEVDDVTMT